MNDGRILTDLEAAVLTEIAFRGNFTAFRVRRAFENSGSASWRGSSGAVYPAIRRLVRDGAIAATHSGDKRGGRNLALTPQGHAALDNWIKDTRRAVDVGFDPFRLRSGLWKRIPPAARRRLLADLGVALAEEVLRLKAYMAEQDDIEREEVELALELQAVRERWLKRAKALVEK